ncbi:hypothetical protein PP836_003366 [Salmonella enterica]|nr:hypothetical protein [Salmonella enterica subsp. diarizonae]EGV3635739.1 hypothetical protein [Salmonella enterica]EKL0443330.1 hypothetical protein [Salmonella enterica]HCM1885506.1 hypothetical protein [Salmonella enterica subsp. diarizonae serovar 57:c:z]
MLKFIIALFFTVFSVFSVWADGQCGSFRISAGPSNDGFMRINGVRPETQKFFFLGKKDDYNNIKIQWIVDTDEPGRWFGMDYIKRDGKAILNVQVLQASMDAPRIYGSFPCHRVK